MNIHRHAVPIALVALLVSLVATAIVLGQSGGGYDLSWWTIGGGGGASSGGQYVIEDTLGQAIASHDASDDGQRYSLTDGFWQTGSTERTIYLPIVIGSGS
jgi:hypothetical protein